MAESALGVWGAERILLLLAADREALEMVALLVQVLADRHETSVEEVEIVT